jgi:Secretion system C-terminal sorting domain/PKD domain
MKLKLLVLIFAACILNSNTFAQCNVQIWWQQSQPGGPVAFSADSVIDQGNGLIGAPGFMWTFSDGTDIAGQQITRIFPQQNGGNAVYEVCVIMSDTVTGCRVTSCDSILITGANSSPCSVVINSSSVDSLYTFVTVNQGSAPYTYTWSLNGQTAGTAAVFTQVLIDTIAGNYNEVCVAVTDSTGCVASGCTDIYATTDSTNCSVYATYMQQDSTYTFMATTIGALPAVYQWSYNNTLISYADTATLVLGPSGFNSNTAVICVTMTTANGCVATSCATVVDTTPVTGRPCQAYFVIYDDTLNGYLDTSGTYYGVNLSTGNYGSNIEWSFGDGTTSTDPYPSHNYAQPGIYIVCLTVGVPGTSCYSTYCDSSFYVSRAMINMSHLVITGASGIKPVSNNMDISVYPNPAENELNILSTYRIETQKIFNITGQLVFESREQTNKMDVSHLAAGVYVLQLSANGSISRVKFVKE